jgi:hypothetical protein
LEKETGVPVERYESESKLNPYKVKVMSEILSIILFIPVDIKKDDRDQRPEMP